MMATPAPIGFLVERMIKGVVNPGLDAKVRRVTQQQPQDTLWHYTTGTNLIAIIRSKELWTTQIACLNDSQELAFGMRFIRELAQRQASDGEQPARQQFYHYLRDWFFNTTNVSSRFFVASLTEEGNDLSQWRAYGGAQGEGGYCIGFDAAHLRRLGFFGKVEYINPTDDGRLELPEAPALIGSVLADTVDAAATSFMAAVEQHGLETSERDEMLRHLVNMSFQGYLWKLIPLLKHGAFHAEREWRIVHELAEAEKARLQFLQRPSMMTRHLPLGFLRDAPQATDKQAQSDGRQLIPLPIREIVVGPARHQEVSKQSVETLLNKHGYKPYNSTETGYSWDEVIVRCSSTPLQAL